MSDKPQLNEADVQAEILKQLKRTNRFLTIFAGLMLASLVGLIVAVVMIVMLIRTTIDTITSLPDNARDATTEQICDSSLGSVIGDSEFCE